MICNRFDVVIVPFPFLERPVTKVRPALVLSASVFNNENGHTILAMITTGAESSWPADFRLQDLQSAGLRHASLVRWKLFTLPNTMLQQVIGQLSERDETHINAALTAMFTN